MSKNSIKEVISNTKELIECSYFSELSAARTCPACAIGRLIQNLPDEKFDACAAVINNEHNNGMGIDSEELKPVAKILTEHYKVDLDLLGTIQSTNDAAFDDDRIEKVLEVVNA